jgi:hypothetical protein
MKKKTVKESFKPSGPAPSEGPRTKPTQFVKVPAPTTDDLRKGYHGKPMNIREES